MEHEIKLGTSYEPKRFQCRHIFADGHRCGSTSLRNEHFCYYHHTTRKPAQNPRARKGRLSAFDLPLPEDRSAIQASIGQIIQRIASNHLDPRRAGLLLYALQIATLNLPKPRPDEEPEPTIEDLTIDPELGPLAPTQEVLRQRGVRVIQKHMWDDAQYRIKELEAKVKQYEAEATQRRLEEKKAAAEQTPAILPTLQAATPPPRRHSERSAKTRSRGTPVFRALRATNARVHHPSRTGSPASLLAGVGSEGWEGMTLGCPIHAQSHRAWVGSRSTIHTNERPASSPA